MLKFLLYTLLGALMLAIIIPLILLIFGEGALVYKIFDWSFSGKDEAKVTTPARGAAVEIDGNTIRRDNSDWDGVIEEVEDNNEGNSISGAKSSLIDNFEVEHNITNQDGLIGMKISVEFTSKNYKGEMLYCMVSFYDSEGNKLVQKEFNEDFRSRQGNVIVGEYFTPSYDDCTSHMEFFMPYKEIPYSKSGRTDYLLDVAILKYKEKTDNFDLLDMSGKKPFYLEHN